MHPQQEDRIKSTSSLFRGARFSRSCDVSAKQLCQEVCLSPCNSTYIFYIGRHDIQCVEDTSLTLEMSSSAGFDRSTVFTMVWGGRLEERLLSPFVVMTSEDVPRPPYRRLGCEREDVIRFLAILGRKVALTSFDDVIHEV